MFSTKMETECVIQYLSDISEAGRRPLVIRGEGREKAEVGEMCNHSEDE